MQTIPDHVRQTLMLCRVPGLGASAYNTLIRHFGSSGNIMKATAAELKQTGISERIQQSIMSPDWQIVDADLDWARQEKNFLLTLEDNLYPRLLKNITAPPPVLYVHGNVDCLDSLQLAIVGSRTPGEAGKENAFRFAHSLASAGMTITSGLALGIDTAAHKGALHAGGKTVAIMGSGIDRVYPGQNHELAHEIARDGALVSEFPLGTGSNKHNFPVRNRVISGMALGCLVVEAALRSGSLITAHHASEQGREVFAIPGSIHNPLSKGCHQLIKQGAKLVETAADIVEELGSLLAGYQADLKTICPESANETGNDNNEHNSLGTDSNLSVEHKLLLDKMGYDRTSIDALVSRTGFSVQEISSMMLILELSGEVKADRGGYYIRQQHGNLDMQI